MHLNTNLGEYYIRLGYYAYMGFSGEKLQNPSEGIFQLYIVPSADRKPEGFKQCVESVFNEVEWDGDSVNITVKITPPLRDPEGLLSRLGSQLDSELEMYDRDKKCPCGHIADDHDRGCRLCNCSGFGYSNEEFTEVNLGDGPGGFKTYE